MVGMDKIGSSEINGAKAKETSSVVV